MSDTTKLAPCWRLAVTVTEAGELPWPTIGQCVACRVGPNWSVENHWGHSAIASYVDAYYVINADGTTGPLVTRGTVARREWTEAPPNDETEIVTLHGDMTPTTEWGQNCQTPWVKTIREGKHEIAWTTPDEFAALLGGQREVTAAMLLNANDHARNQSDDERSWIGARVDHINAALREAL